MQPKTCFVISPLSDKGSEIRREADALLWAITQAVSKHSFSVVRIDEVTKTHEITREIVRYVRESALCVIILTGNNPNVYYEAGRRHETGRPFIHLVREGERLPFDVAAISTIHYGDFEKLPAIQELVEAIESFVVSMKSEIEGSDQEEVTLEAIAVGIQRLEDKIDRLPRTAHTPRSASLPDDPTLVMRNPREAFMLSIARGDLAGAVALLPRLESIIGRTKEFLHAGLMCAQAGANEGVSIALSFLKDPPPWLDSDETLAIIGVLVNYFSMTDHEQDGIAQLFPIIDEITARPDITQRQRATLVNQKQRLLYGVGKYEEALGIAEEVLRIAPDEPAYYHNASMIYEKLGLLTKAREMVDKLLEFSDADDDHLMQAIDVYIAVGDKERARVALDKLRTHFPEKANLVMLKKEVRDLLQ